MKRNILFFAVTIILASCRSIEYYPTTYNAPLFTDGEQFECTVNWGKSGTEAQISLAPINHFGFIATGSYADRNSSSEFNQDDNDSETDDNFHKHMFGEAGIGYFTKIGTKASFEVYGGYGQGKTEGYNDDWITDYDRATYSKYFLQPTIGLTNDVFEGAFISRFSMIDMKSKVHVYQSQTVFYEPGIVLKVGYKFVKFYSQIGLSVPIIEGDDELLYDHSVFNVSIGLNFSIGRNYFK